METGRVARRVPKTHMRSRPSSTAHAQKARRCGGGKLEYTAGSADAPPEDRMKLVDMEETVDSSSNRQKRLGRKTGKERQDSLSLPESRGALLDHRAGHSDGADSSPSRSRGLGVSGACSAHRAAASRTLWRVVADLL